jgi:hypothetical protein
LVAVDGINGVGASYSSFVPSCCDAKNADVIIGYRGKRMSPEMAMRTQNLRFAHLLCAAQQMSKLSGLDFQASSVTAIIGFGAVPLPGFIRKS